MLRVALASLPRTLDEAYARILCGIDEQYREYAFKILQWLTYSFEPLTWEELAEIVAIDIANEPAFDPDSCLTGVSDILTICASLIAIDGAKAQQFDRDDTTSDNTASH